MKQARMFLLMCSANREKFPESARCSASLRPHRRSEAALLHSDPPLRASEVSFLDLTWAFWLEEFELPLWDCSETDLQMWRSCSEDRFKLFTGSSCSAAFVFPRSGWVCSSASSLLFLSWRCSAFLFCGWHSWSAEILSLFVSRSVSWWWVSFLVLVSSSWFTGLSSSSLINSCMCRLSLQLFPARTGSRGRWVTLVARDVGRLFLVAGRTPSRELARKMTSGGRVGKSSSFSDTCARPSAPSIALYHRWNRHVRNTTGVFSFTYLYVSIAVPSGSSKLNWIEQMLWTAVSFTYWRKDSQLVPHWRKNLSTAENSNKERQREAGKVQKHTWFFRFQM